MKKTELTDSQKENFLKAYQNSRLLFNAYKKASDVRDESSSATYESAEVLSNNTSYPLTKVSLETSQKSDGLHLAMKIEQVRRHTYPLKGKHHNSVSLVSFRHDGDNSEFFSNMFNAMVQHGNVTAEALNKNMEEIVKQREQQQQLLVRHQKTNP